MDLMLLRLFQKQVLFQCESVMFAASGINIAIENHDLKLLFYELQNLLNAAANISKALWGQGGKLSAQRKALRDSIGVSDDSLLKVVLMRNNFEHFDERLESWWRDSKRHNYLDFSAAAKSSVTGLDPIDRFRVYDASTTDLYFWSQEFNIQEIISEIKNIFPKLQEEASKPHFEVVHQSEVEEASSTYPDEAKG